VVIVGFDGMDPELANRFMGEENCRIWRSFATTGPFVRCDHIPRDFSGRVSTFQTGVNPGKHNIYDFWPAIEKLSPLPFFSADQRAQAPPAHRQVLAAARQVRGQGLRRGTPFWHWLGKAGVFCSVIRVPVTFRPKVSGVLLFRHGASRI